MLFEYKTIKYNSIYNEYRCKSVGPQIKQNGSPNNSFAVFIYMRWKLIII